MALWGKMEKQQLICLVKRVKNNSKFFTVEPQFSNFIRSGRLFRSNLFENQTSVVSWETRDWSCRYQRGRAVGLRTQVLFDKTFFSMNSVVSNLIVRDGKQSLRTEVCVCFQWSCFHHCVSFHTAFWCRSKCHLYLKTDVTTFIIYSLIVTFQRRNIALNTSARPGDIKKKEF